MNTNIILFLTLWILSNIYSESILFTSPHNIQQLSPTEIITSNILISTLIAISITLMHTQINSTFHTNHNSHVLILRIILILSNINIILYINIIIFNELNNIFNIPQITSNISIINYYQFNLILLIIFLLIENQKHACLKHAPTILTVLSFLIFLPTTIYTSTAILTPMLYFEILNTFKHIQNTYQTTHN